MYNAISLQQKCWVTVIYKLDRMPECGTKDSDSGVSYYEKQGTQKGRLLIHGDNVRVGGRRRQTGRLECSDRRSIRNWRKKVNKTL
jgi:hypothetical protein